MLDVKVQPRAGRNSVELAEDGTVTVRVTAPPEGRKANDAVVVLLARRLGVARSSVAIVWGRTARRKLVRTGGGTGPLTTVGLGVSLTERSATQCIETYKFSYGRMRLFAGERGVASTRLLKMGCAEGQSPFAGSLRVSLSY